MKIRQQFQISFLILLSFLTLNSFFKNFEIKKTNDFIQAEQINQTYITASSTPTKEYDIPKIYVPDPPKAGDKEPLKNKIDVVQDDGKVHTTDWYYSRILNGDISRNRQGVMGLLRFGYVIIILAIVFELIYAIFQISKDRRNGETDLLTTVKDSLGSSVIALILIGGIGGIIGALLHF